MEKFAFTQCVAVLFQHPPELSDVERALQRWTLTGDANAPEGEYGWAVSGKGYVFDMPVGGGFATVDIVDRPWPDDAATAAKTPALTAAWRMGAFGPAASPG